MSGTSYRVRVKGGLSERFAAGFEGVTLERSVGEAVLVGRLDQSQLYGLLQRLRDLGFELLAVEEVPE
jgi:hypothetical protein